MMKTIGRVINLSLHIIWWPFIFVPSFKKISPRVSELLSSHILKCTKGHNSIKNVGGVTMALNPRNLGPKFGPIPKAKKYGFFPILDEKIPNLTNLFSSRIPLVN